MTFGIEMGFSYSGVKKTNRYFLNFVRKRINSLCDKKDSLNLAPEGRNINNRGLNASFDEA
jgi:hypothetical protein